ncbi:hypothetical protein BDB01DRAFT_853772 [Pilobolus umbonatus]|nr:hypothetical protein BDB01DRAFT_853772 [Pilobolus umbonatus]
MLKELGVYEPFGKQYIERYGSIAANTRDRVVDFSSFQSLVPATQEDFYQISQPSNAPFIDLFASQITRPVHNEKKYVENMSLDLEDELYIQGATVVWTRGEVIKKVFNYEKEHAVIKQAIFAWFQFETHDTTNELLDIRQSSLTSFLMAKKEPPQGIQHRGLCIVCEDFIDIYLENGIFIKCQTHFAIGEVSALNNGIIMSRLYDMGKGKPKAQVPTFLTPFYTLSNPYHDVSLVKSRDSIQYRSGSLLGPIANPQKILFTSQNAERSVMVTLNLRDNKHYMWEYEKITDAFPYIPMGTKRKSTVPVPPKKKYLKGKNKKRVDPEAGNLLRSFHRLTDTYRKDGLLNFEQEVEREHDLLDPDEVTLKLLWKETYTAKVSTRLKSMKSVKSKAFLTHDLNGDEVICIMNYSLSTLTRVYSDKDSVRRNHYADAKIPARSAIPIQATRDTYHDLLLLDSSGLSLFLSKSIPKIVLNDNIKDIKEIIDPIHNKFTILYNDHRRVRYQINIKPKSILVKDCLTAIDCAANAQFPMIWYRFLTLAEEDEWRRFTMTLLSFFQLKMIQPDETWAKIQSISTDFFDPSILQDIVNNLHIAFEEYRVRITQRMKVMPLGSLLIQCASILKNETLVSYYQENGIPTNCIKTIKFIHPIPSDHPMEPPNISICLRQMTANTSSNPTLLSYFKIDSLDPSVRPYHHTYSKTIKMIWSLYGALYHLNGTYFMDRMVTHRVTWSSIDMLEDAISLPLQDKLRELKENPQLNWHVDAYSILGRDDIYKQLSMPKTPCDPNTANFKSPRVKDHKPRQITDLIDQVDKKTPKHLFSTDILDMETERLRFGCGGVIEHVKTLLDPTQVVEVEILEEPGTDDEELASNRQLKLLNLMQRTTSHSLGIAIYAFGTYSPNCAKSLPIEHFEVTAKIMPAKTLATFDYNLFYHDDYLDWPKFHSGVAAGLRISPSSKISDSWISLCHQYGSSPENGGTLLAMGLNRLFTRLQLIDWYPFIAEMNDLASVGFILGISSAYRESKDSEVTKLLSVHIAALLPESTTLFQTYNVVQAASMLGIGLVYMNTCDRLMVSAMLTELSRNAYADPCNLNANYEGCALAAGFSMGLIALGAGDDCPELSDFLLRDRLYSLMTGRSNLYTSETLKRDKKDGLEFINLDITSPGATMALALMYLKTENQRIARRVDILETRSYLNYVRPDFLLIRVVAKNLILWSTIEPYSGWIDRHLPDFITAGNSLDEELTKQAKYNIIAGACLSMGLKYAGTRNKEAFKSLLSRLDYFIKLLNVAETTPQQTITKGNIRTCIDVLCTANAMVMAGTGDKELLSRLISMNARIETNMNYGHHMAVSMSLGLLFVGLGGYTLQTTNEAIAGLLVAFYPFYPVSMDDNRYHLQAFRHFWILALDTRWLMTFDVDDNKPCRVPLKLELYHDEGSTLNKKTKSIRIEAPYAVPDYKLIKSISLDSNRFWPLNIDMVKGEYQDSIIRSGLIHVKRKPGEKSFEEDPDGRRNVFKYINNK